MSYVHRFAILFASALFLGGCGGSDELTCPSDGPVRPVQIAAGNSHTCARFSDGTVRCWGLNDFGQVGAGADVTQASPHLVSGIHCAAGMALGFRHTCVLLVDGTVRCWGGNEEGELGTGSREGSRVPQQPNLGGVVAITAGANGSGALLSSGLVMRWGGKFPDDGPDEEPVPIADLANVQQLALARSNYCGITADHALHCGGDNSWGQLCDGTTDPVEGSRIVAGVSAAQVAVAGGSICAVSADGSLRCWGRNDDGQLGDGTTEEKHVPTLVAGIEDAVQVSIFYDHACARRSNGTISCWGSNIRGQLGTGETGWDYYGPTQVMALDGAIDVAVGYEYGCAITSDGRILCWGHNNSNQLGIGGFIQLSVPTEVQWQ